MTGNNKPVELRVFIETIEKSIGKKAEIISLGPQPGDVPQTYADISKAQRYLGFAPKTPLDVGLKIFAKWYMDEYIPLIGSSQSQSAPE